MLEADFTYLNQPESNIYSFPRKGIASSVYPTNFYASLIFIFHLISFSTLCKQHVVVIVLIVVALNLYLFNAAQKHFR